MIEIDKIQTGRGLDTLVAVWVMGWRAIGLESFPPGSKCAQHVPGYSTTMAAWNVVEAMSRKNWLLHPLRQEVGSFPGVIWCARFVDVDFADGPWEAGFIAYAKTAPLAICRAALKAVVGGETLGGENNEGRI